MAEDHSLTQVVTESTRGEKRTLDLRLTDRPALVNRQIVTPPLTATADHTIVILDIDAHAYIPKKKPHQTLLYHKVNWDELKKKSISMPPSLKPNPLTIHSPCGMV